MSRTFRRTAAVATATLLTSAAFIPTASADVEVFPDTGGHITSVRVSHGSSNVAVTARDAEMEFTTYYRFWLDTDPKDPGPEYKTEVYPNSDGMALQKVENFSSEGTNVRCGGYRAIADAYGPEYAKIIVPRSCLGNPSKVRVSVTGFYDENPDVVDWAPGTRKFTPWVYR